MGGVVRLAWVERLRGLASSPVGLGLQVLVMVAGFCELTASDAFYVPYLLIALAGLVCMLACRHRPAETKGGGHSRAALGFSLLLALMIFLANYRVWDVGGLREPLTALAMFLGSWVALYHLLHWLGLDADGLAWSPESRPWPPLRVFLLAFLAMGATYLLVLFLCKYPGNLTPDSISQLTQIETGVYSNHHPFYHTLIIRLFVTLGYALFGSVGAAVATYSTAQALLMAATFALAVATVDEMGAPRWVCVVMVALFALLPYHIMYSITMWKDIPFGLCVLLFCVFLHRLMTGMSLRWLNWAGFALSSLGVCLMRSNGLVAFLVCVVAVAALWRLDHRRVLLTMVVVACVAFVMERPLLAALGVTQTDLVESLSIPVQQVARDVVENDDFSDDQLELLSQVIDVDSVADEYSPYISDPIKGLVRERGNEGYLASHAGEYVRLYLSRMTLHPFSYLKGWIDETRGYWNSGYDYWRWYDGVIENDLGIARQTSVPALDGAVSGYLAWFEDDPFLQTLVSLGLADWVVLVALFVAVCRRDRLAVAEAVPMVAVVLTLLVATPVAYEFRYDYATFCALPFVLAATLRPKIAEAQA